MAGFMIPLSFSRISVSQKTPISFVIPGSLRSIVNKSCHALQNSSSCSSCSVKKLVPVFVFSKWAALTSLQSRPFRAFMDPRPQVLGSFISKASFASMAGGSAAEKEKEFRAQADGIPGLRLTVWDQQDLTPKFPKIDRDESADVVVVGAGIAGLSVAYNLVKEGKSVVVLEAKTLGSGQTGRTTAHIMLWFDDFYYKIEKDHGLEIAKLVADSHKKAIDFVENTTKEEGIDCHFCRLDGYLFPHDDSAGAMDIILKEFEACKRVGLDVSMADLGDDPTHGRAGKAIRFPRCADFHPLLYIKGLADAIVRRGGKIYEQSHVFNTEQNKVSTTEGVTVSAQAVVMATNSPLSHNLAVHARQTAYRTYVVGFKVPKGSVKKANWWDTADPYHYVRLESKPDCDVLIVGGEDTDGGMKPSDFPDPYSALEKWTRQRWATAGEVLYKWTGQWYDPVDYLYHIGLNPVQRDHYLITGDSGQGMTGGTIGGILIKDMILHRNNPWEIAYDPGRRPPISMKTGKNAAHEASRTIHGYKDHIPGVGADSIDIEDMQTRSGAVIEKGKKKFAIYKDDNGVIHKYSAICPHMNCIVKWNPIDSTFDCPCHGSMFDNLGRCINGPAKADLFPED